MTTATTPTALVHEAEAALTAARAADTFLKAHPDLPVARLHALGPAELDQVDGPVLEVQLDNDTAALKAFAKSIGTVVEDVNEVEFRVTVEQEGVTVWVSAWDFDDEPTDF